MYVRKKYSLMARRVGSAVSRFWFRSQMLLMMLRQIISHSLHLGFLVEINGDDAIYFMRVKTAC